MNVKNRNTLVNGLQPEVNVTYVALFAVQSPA